MTKPYMSQALHAVRLGSGLTRLMTSRKHMKHRVLRWWAKWLLRQRSLIETLHEQVKNIRQIEHTLAPQGARVQGQAGREFGSIWFAAEKTFARSQARSPG